MGQMRVRAPSVLISAILLPFEFNFVCQGQRVILPALALRDRDRARSGRDKEEN